MNLSISHDGAAIVLRIELPAGDDPILIDGLTPRNSAMPRASIARQTGRSWLQSRPVRLLALGAVLLAFVQVGMVLSGPSRSAVAPELAVVVPAQTPAKGTKSVGAVPPEVAIADALASQPRMIGSTTPPAVKPGSATAQSRFGLDP